MRSAQALAEEDRVGVTGGQSLHGFLRPEFQQGRVVRRDPIGRKQRQQLDAEAVARRADGDALSPEFGERDFTRRVAAKAPQGRVEEVRCVDDRAGLLGVRGAGREEGRIDALLRSPSSTTLSAGPRVARTSTAMPCADTSSA